MGYGQGLNSIAGAALTPGGVTSGLSDLVGALTQAPLQARRIQMEQANRVADRLMRQRQMDQALNIAQMQESGANERWKYRADAYRDNTNTRSKSAQMQGALRAAVQMAPKYADDDLSGLSPDERDARLMMNHGKAPTHPLSPHDRATAVTTNLHELMANPDLMAAMAQMGGTDDDTSDDTDPTGAIPPGLAPAAAPTAAPAQAPAAPMPAAPPAAAPTQAPTAAAPAPIGPTNVANIAAQILPRLHPDDQAAYQQAVARDPGAANARLLNIAKTRGWIQ